MKTKERVGTIIVAFAFLFSLGCVGCCGGFGSREAPAKKIDEREATTKKIAEADSRWNRGEKASAIAEYKSVYTEAIPAEKEKFLPRIVEFETKAGNINEAKTWIKSGLDDQLNVEYTDPAAKELFTAAKKEHDEARASAAAEDARKKKEAAAEAVRSAEAAAEAAAQAKAEAARRAEEEYEVNGLVLLLKTLSAKRGQFGGQITGTVVNRRNHKLNYAQISFNLYDASGAQIGSALANINGLEAGGRWNFTASTFGKDFHSYKFSELSGF
jgi:hypothetical protein